ncbi:hypothetical protein GCM10007862_10230 [Dyella lipolytica]|nr:hypothetical protein GCM10007862_10230 [Dyella lipolytica]
MRFHCIAVFLCAVVAGCTAAGASEPSVGHEVIGTAGLQADVDSLQRIYETLHPGLLRYNTPDEIKAHFALLRRALDHDQSRASVFIALSQFAATIKCGHTYANFYNQSHAVQAELFNGTNRVPFYFRWIDGRMIITRNLSSDKRLRPGSEILAINGVATSQILKTLMTVARADGANDAKRVAYLEVQGNDDYEAFDIFLPLFYPQTGSIMKLKASDTNGVAWTTSVAALSYKERLSFRPKAAAGSEAPWELTFPSPGVALLDMPTWVMYNRTWDWHRYLGNVFAKLQATQVRSLIIDVRANEGGDDVGNVILAHLIERDLALPNYLRLVRYQSVPRDLLPNLDTWDASFKDWGAKVRPYNDRFYRLTKYDDDARGTIITALSPRFAGRVFVLIGPTNSSATFQFADIMKSQHLGMLVGQPTGGNRRGINGGAFFFVRLLHSGLEMDLPLIGTFPVVKQPDSGIDPDIRVVTTIEDIKQGHDPELQRALSLASAVQ